jgi:hypothetical protein
MSAENEGLYGKFHVSRVDGKDLPGGSKENARYFVLDYVNDIFARDALWTYAVSCGHKFPELAEDLKKELRETL